MVTFKRLGLKMTRDEGGWRVTSKDGRTIYQGKGNKGSVMHECLKTSGEFEQVGRFWRVANGI